MAKIPDPSDLSEKPGLMSALSHDATRRGALAGMLAGLAPLGLRADQVGAATTSTGSLEQLRTIPVSAGAVEVDGVIWQFVAGDHTGRVDMIDIVGANGVPPSKGAWTRLSDHAIMSHRTDPGALSLRMVALTDSLPRRPEEFGAVGDGVHDDAPAIQKALDSIAALSRAHTDGFTRPGVLMLTQGKRYKCGSRIVMDRRFHTMTGYATLDFSSWTGVYLQVSGSLTEYGNANGQNGAIEGQIVIVGSGANKKNVGILYETPIGGSATSIRTVGLTVCRCGVAFQIGSRGYNQDFINCKAFDCDVIFDWLGNAEDSDERTTVFGGTFFNSRLFLRHMRSAGAFYAFSCSIDYTEQVVDVVSGKVQLFGVHLESSRWVEAPVKVAGNGGMFSMHGGWFFTMENKGGMTHFIDVAAGCCVKFHDVITHNTHILKTPNAYTPTTWATGAGRFEMHGTEPAFEFGGFPARLHDRSTVLADPGFEEADVQINPIWRTADVNPIRSRDGADARLKAEPAHNMTFARATSGQMEGSGCLRINKTYGGGSPAAMVVVAIPVRYGDNAKGGLRIRTAPDRPGNSRKIAVRGGFAILDGMDQYGVPLIRKFISSGDLTIAPPTESYVMAAPGNGAPDFKAPSWATHYLIQVDLHFADQASFLIDGRWADRW
jgi:hypothetical protein